MRAVQASWARAVLSALCAACLFGAAAPAEVFTEVWRSPFGTPYSVAVNPADGSCWAATGGSVMHLSAEGETLSQTDGFRWPHSVSVDPDDGSCWVADFGLPGALPDGTVTHLASDGTRLAVLTDFVSPSALAVAVGDGSCWVADEGNEWLVHLAADHSVLWQGEGPRGLCSVAVNPVDGSCWAGGVEVLHLSVDGTALSRSALSGYAPSLSVDPRDGSCWVAEVDLNTHWDYVTHLSSTGEVLWRSGDMQQFFGPSSVWVSPIDGSCLVADTQHSEVALLSADGTELWRRGGFSLPLAVAANPVDGSIFVGDDGMHCEIAKFDADGEEQWRRGGMRSPRSVSVDPRDGSCWVADPNRGQAIRLAENGVECLRLDIPAQSVSVNPSDGSCWVGGLENREVVHVASDGSETWRGGYGAGTVCVDPADGSCWAADYPPFPPGGPTQLVHLSASGAELWRGGSFTYVPSLSVNPTDGSCWVADQYNDLVVHLSADGEQLWSGDIDRPRDVSVSPGDGSCWVAQNWVLHLAADGTQLAQVAPRGTTYAVSVDAADGSCWVGEDSYLEHLAPDGTVLWSGPVGMAVSSVSANPADGTCWIADSFHDQVVHLAPPGYRQPTFSDVPSAFWAFAQVESCYDAGIVSGFPNGTYQPCLPVTRDQAAVFMARALAGSDAGVPAPPPTATFPDVPTDYWAFGYIEYCAQQGVVAGYADGYHPADPVTRDQMAAFVARAIATPTGEAGLDSYAPPSIASFSDVPTDNWAYKYIEYCKSRGVVRGYWDGYHPLEVVTRDQMAVFMERAYHVEPMP